MSNTKNNFKADLKTGQEAEKQFAECAEKELQATNIIFNTSTDVTELKKWDLKYTNTSGNEVTFEIKNDVMSSTTGNFAVEWYGSFDYSGISTTTANYWVILSNAKFYIFKTTELRKLIKDNNFRNLQINNKTAYCYLIPITKAAPLAVRIINIT